MILILTFTQLLVVTLVVTAVLLGSAIGYLFLRARQFERSDALSEGERAELQRRDKEILLIRQRIEEIYQGQQRGAQTQHALVLQQVEQVQHELKNRSRQIDTLQSQLRHEMQQREAAMNELRDQLSEAVRALSSAAPARALPQAAEPKAEAAQPAKSKPHPPAEPTTDASWLDEPVEIGFSDAVVLDSSELDSPESNYSEPAAEPFAPEPFRTQPSETETPAFTPLEELFSDDFFSDAQPAAQPPSPEADEEPENGGVIPLGSLIFGDESDDEIPDGFVLADFDPDTFEAFEPDADWLSAEPEAAEPEATLPPAEPSDEPAQPAEHDPLEDLVQWTPLSFDEPTAETPPTGDAFGDSFGDSFGGDVFTPSASFEGDGYHGDGSSKPEPEPPARPQGAEDLTALPSVSEKQERALYDVGLHTVEDIARLSRADARRIARALGGSISEDDIMNVWVFEAQSVLFERYQNELHVRRTQA